MTKISLILFDLNGVLFRYQRDARIGYLSAVSGQPPAAIERAIWASGFEDSGDAGTLDAAAYLQGFGDRLGCALAEADWVAAQRAAVTPITESLALLPRLRRGVDAAVLTNNNLLVKRHFAALYPEAAVVTPGRACVSAEFGCRKPDPEVYRRCVGQLGGVPAATLFVDDSGENVAGAVQAGLQAWHYTDPTALEAALRGHGLID